MTIAAEHGILGGRAVSARHGALKARAVRFARRAATLIRPRWETIRTTALSVGGFACLDAAAFQWTTAAGLAATGVSLLLLETLSGGDG